MQGSGLIISRPYLAMKGHTFMRNRSHYWMQKVTQNVHTTLSVPISFLGVGESYDDLSLFDLDNYLELLVKK